MAFTVVRKMLGTEQPSPVLPRSDQAKAPCPHSTGRQHFGSVIFFVVPLPQVISCFLHF
uniref:Uncharacterized protein n=1 Tax=Ursus americanus TaxID=9643 RepID=A0A452SDM9_URSAM